MGGFSPGQDHKSGGVHIQPVYGGLRYGVREKNQYLPDYAVLFIRTTSGYGQQAGWFFDNDDVIINIE